MKTALRKIALLLAAVSLISLCACTLISADPTPTGTGEQSPTPTEPEKPGELPGYWAALTETEDEVYTLEGFYFSPDGKGLKFTASEGALEITSYLINESYFTVYFLNTAGEAAEETYRIDKVTEKTLVIVWEEKLPLTYERVQKIEAASGAGTYVITRLDGTTVSADGGPAEIDLETLSQINDYLDQYGEMPMFMEAGQINADWLIKRFYTAEKNETDSGDYEFFTPLSAVQAAAQRYINPDLSLSAPADPSQYKSEIFFWSEQQQGFAWNPSENAAAQHIYIIEKNVVQGGVYTIVCVELEISWQDAGDEQAGGMLLLDGQIVGTISINESGGYEYAYIAQFSALPRTTFVMRDGLLEDGERTFVFERKYRS
jgi:hypothetical protein